MDINQFFKEFKTEVDLLLEEDVLIGLERIDELEDGTYTLLFDIAMYHIAKKNNFTLLPEHPTGRGGYSDITLFSSDGKKKLFEVEHENRPLHKNKNKRIAIYKSLDNLNLSKARYKILITYTYKNISAEELLDKCIKYLQEKRLKIENLFLIYAKEDVGDGEDYFMIQLNCNLK